MLTTPVAACRRLANTCLQCVNLSARENEREREKLRSGADKHMQALLFQKYLYTSFNSFSVRYFCIAQLQLLCLQ